MSVVSTIEVAADEFPLGGALATNPGIEVTLECFVPLGSTIIPYIWVKDDSIGDIERALRDDDDVGSVRVLGRVNGKSFVRVEWKDGLDGPLDGMAATGATILNGVGSDGSWTFQLLFDDHDSLTRFYRECVQPNPALDVQGVHDPGVPGNPGFDANLSEIQRETLRVALERGYFDIPRKCNLGDLGREMGVSDSAVSQRIRRGVTTILETRFSEATP